MNEEKRPRTRRTSISKRRRQKSLVLKALVFLVIIVGFIGGAFLLKKYSPTKERADLNEYYGIEKENQLAVIIGNEVIGAKGLLLNGKAYVDYSVVRDYLNDRFYVDYHENILLYTLSDGTITAQVGSSEYVYQRTTQDVGYPLLKMEGNAAYIALDFVQKYTNMEFRIYEQTDIEPSRVMIHSGDGETTLATVRRDTQVRLRGGVKSPILTDVSKKATVTVIEDVGGWKKVCTEDGYIGYIKSSCLKNEHKEMISRPFEEQKYPSVKKDYTINLAWHVVTNWTANDSVLSMIADTKGLTTISPTWFTVADTKGNINSLASARYVNYAHQAGIEGWALVRDFDGGISSYEESYELLSRTSSRERLINQLIAQALNTGIDGINVDFEKISAECGEHYMQFIRELAVKCRQNEIIISVDNYVPKGYNKHYNLKEQGVVADYVIIMGYDEHYNGSYESGPVASLEYAKTGIEDTLKVVPKEKVISGVPFYTRLWKEVPKSAEELEKQAGTEAGEHEMKVTSLAYGMAEAEQAIRAAGAKITVDEATGQNYAEWKKGDATYKIWLEDHEALEKKLQLLKQYELAGNAAWRLGFEKSGTWDLILRYVN